MNEEITIEQATEEINALFFPAVEEGDNAEHHGFKFIYTNGEWVEVEE